MFLTQNILSVLAIITLIVTSCVLIKVLGIGLGGMVAALMPPLILLFVNPGRSLTLAWACLFFLPLLVREFLGGSAYIAMSELIVATVWASWLARSLLEGKTRGAPRPLIIIGILILAVSGTSVILNGSNPLLWVEWIFSYLLPIPVLAISRSCLARYTHQRLLRIVIVCLLIQFVLNMSWYAGVNPLPNRSAWPDLSCGTYANTAATAYFMVAVIGGAICYLTTVQRRLRIHLTTGFYLMLAAIQFVFTFTLHAYIFLPLTALLPIAITARSRGSLRRAAPLVASLGLVIAAIIVAPLFQNIADVRRGPLRSTPSEFSDRLWESVWHGPKVDIIRKVLSEASPAQLAVGMGPNAAVSYTGALLGSPQTNRLIADWVYTLSGRQELSTGSIRENIFSGTVMLLSEIGIIGMLFYFGLLLYPLLHIYRRVRQYSDTSPETSFLVGAVVMLLVMNLAIGIVWDVWRIRMLSITIWLLAGRIWDPPMAEAEPADLVTDPGTQAMPAAGEA